MKFGVTELADAEGAILAHGVESAGLNLPKATVLTADAIKELKKRGVTEVIAARLEHGEINEDQAAEQLAGAMRGGGFSARPASTGRVNLHAAAGGVFTVDAAVVDRLNAIDPAITFATLHRFAAVAADQMVATVKIIPFGVRDELVAQCEALCASHGIMAVHPFRPRETVLIQTVLSGTRPKILDKTLRVTKNRLSRSGSRIARELRCSHDRRHLARSIGDAVRSGGLIIIFGASATSDADDIIPAAIGEAGGTVFRVGMPVDPGNLITVGEVEGVPIIGAPGCARSPKENGFDWVLDRILADIPVTGADIAGMGVGGLLMEIPARPRPREQRSGVGGPNLSALLLAAGKSTRMGRPNKLLARFDGAPLIGRTAAALLGAGLPVTVVTGHQRERIEQALAGSDVHFLHNADFAGGLSTSLKTGMRALPESVDGVLVMPADMPGVTPENIRAIIRAFIASGGSAIIRATHAGKRGNPVILPRSVFSRVEETEGDTGARHIVESGDVPVIDVEIGKAASVDVDTPELLEAAGGRFDPDEA